MVARAVILAKREVYNFVEVKWYVSLIVTVLTAESELYCQ